MTIQERIISSKRHTIGYVIDGEEFTKHQTITHTKKGLVSNAKVVKTVNGAYLMGKQGTRIYDLPTRFSMSRRFAKKRRA